MTKEEWVKVEKALQSLYSIVELKIDGYKVALKLERLDTYKNAIAVYINGEFKGKWLIEECEERRRFLRKREKSLITPKQRKDLNKLPKKFRKEHEEWFNRSYVYYEPWWNSFNSLKRHLISENESIELVKII
ncbi:MAG: hypothetical protein VB130_00250 [Clostridium sp.]|nr:hypothetical protein [Clostridium sp.]